MSDRSESAISSSVTKRWEDRGGIVVRIHSGQIQLRGRWMYLGPKGQPDYLVLCPHGLSFFAELKKEGEKPSEGQQRWHMKARSLGHLVFVVRDEESADAAWEEVMRG